MSEKIEPLTAFEESLVKLCAVEIPHARRDPERLAAMIERLADSLALTLAIAGGGDMERTNRLYSGAESYMLGMITDYQRVAKRAGNT